MSICSAFQSKTEGGAATGKGLFSSIELNKGDTICAFKGKVITKDDYDR